MTEPQPAPVRVQEPRNGFGITALVLALVGFVFGMIPFTGFIALILGAIAVLFGFIGWGRARRGTATNKKMSAIGAFLGVGVVALGVWGLTVVFGAFEELDEELSNADDVDAADSGSSGNEEEQAEAEDAEHGSRDDPLDVGTTIEMGEWSLAVTEITPDATEVVMTENEFNEPPADGRQFVVFQVDATYNGDESGTAWLDFGWAVVGSSGNTFGGDSMDDHCGVIPNPLDETGETYSGGDVSGNVCVSAPSDQLDGGSIRVEDSFSLDDTRAFYSLR